jgi:hypothetical protein
LGTWGEKRKAPEVLVAGGVDEERKRRLDA